VSVIKLLFVDDDAALRTVLGAALERHGFLLTAAGSVPEALELISTQRFDVLLADLNIGEPGDGFTIVSAMRRVQPDACTFILTGYPDLETAMRALRSQVDDYFSKPLQVEQLAAAISAVRSGKPRSRPTVPSRKVSEILRDLTPDICELWLSEVLQDPDLAAIPLSHAERSDHVPEMMDELIRRLEGPLDELSAIGTSAARKHGRTRYQQGYSIPQILRETRILQQVLSAKFQENLFGLDLSTLVPDILEIGESLQAEVEVSIRVYQAQIPRSLQSSFSQLYQSPHLGVAIADEEHIIDANDALLRMIGRTREQLTAGEIDWRAITPERFRTLDASAIEQLREFGACVPFEKEFTLPDASSLPFLIGGVRLDVAPLLWSAFVVDLTEQRKLHQAEQKVRAWETRYVLINELAHELNNPLAALTFSLHLLATRPDVSEDTLKLVKDAKNMVDRIATTVRRVLVEVRQ
jgi:ActR/RegA family two-component response regulator/PAS domain-containing protein